MGHEIAGGQFMIRHEGIPMCCWHDKRGIPDANLLLCVRLGAPARDAGIDRIKRSGVLNHLTELIDILYAIISIACPYV
jgi:hypothetical protein